MCFIVTNLSHLKIKTSIYIVFECLKFIKINAIENRINVIFRISHTDRKVSQHMKIQKLLVQGLLSVPWGKKSDVIF